MSSFCATSRVGVDTPSRSGIDGGGVFKEFLTELCKEVFDKDKGLWLENTKHEIYPNAHSYATERKKALEELVSGLICCSS